MTIEIDTVQRTINNISSFIVDRCCSVCGGPIGYRLAPSEIAIVYDSTCDCSDGETLRLVKYEEFVYFMQNRDSKDKKIIPFGT